MKTFQKTVVILIILLPVLIGILVITRTERTPLPIGSFRYIGLVRLEGEIMESTEILRQLRAFRQDKSAAGVLLRIDSPGGAVAPSQEIYQELMRFRSAKKPLVVSCGNVAASGGYYIASAAERIFCDPGTLTGSIGVIMTLPNFKKLTEKIGVDFQVLKAGKFKDIGSPFRSLSDNEKLIFGDLLNDTHDQFISDVANARALSYDSIQKVADGRVFTGRQAVRLKLVDTLGGFDDAMGYLKQKSGLPEHARVVERIRKSSIFSEWLIEESFARLPALNSLRRSSGCQFLFDPGL